MFVVDALALGEFTGPGRDTAAILAELAPPTFPRELITRTACRLLHRVEALSDTTVGEVCDELHIDRDRWPSPWPASGFRIHEDALPCLKYLSNLGPVAVLSNLAVLDANRMTALEEECGDYLTQIHTSYMLGACKPARWLWHFIADITDVACRDVIHVGPDWAEDVLGPLAAGCRAIWINPNSIEPPGDGALPVRHWATANTLSIATAIATGWAGDNNALLSPLTD
jgi:FMN phosphatase YigB (HAD superfamily)